jgi:uncharacterized protein with gpF-like domain
MKPKPKTVRAIHANQGIESSYRRKLQTMVEEMANSAEYWLKAAYRKAPPRMAFLAQDASPADRIKKVLAELAKRWTKRFEDYAPILADAYVKDMFKASDSAFRRALKDAGWSVEFKMTPAMRDALNASIAENVGLIRSIPQQYLGKVEGSVMRNYAVGRDLQSMVKEIQSIYPVTKKRAGFIARDQSNKANAVVNRARQLELGITEAIWMHSHAGKVPRPGHVKAGAEKRVFKIAEGCLIDGEYIQPGFLINCRCTSRAILPF